MPIFEITQSAIRKLTETTFGAAGVRERADLQRLLRGNIDVVSPDTLVISEEFGDWEDSRRRIDLLGLDRDANLVVIELKRTEDGGHMELQAIRYAAMVSTLTFEKVVDVFSGYLRRVGKEDDARTTILEFLGWEDPDEDIFAQDVRIVLASAEFSKELTTAVMWLNEHGLDIRCVRMKPYDDGGRLLVDVQQVIPLPEAAAYQVQVREKEQRGRQERAEKRQWDEASFFDALRQRQGEQEIAVARCLLEWVRKKGLRDGWGEGKLDGSLFAMYDNRFGKNALFSVWTYGTVELQFQRMIYPPFSGEENRKELARRLSAIPGVSIPETALTRRPSFKLGILTGESSLNTFLEVFDWVLTEIKKAETEPDSEMNHPCPEHSPTLG
jgi:hypothetical protein